MKNTIHISVSSGISIYPQHATTTEGLIKNSDVAMYRAKKDGKNKHIVFQQEMDKDFSERIDMENGLRKAIEEKEFLLHYQPQLALKTGEIVGFEALIRWDRPDYGLIAPLKFIGIAEETGLIVQIGRWVLQTACGFMKALNDTMHSSYKVSVNISVVQLMQGDFVSMVKEVLETTGFNPMLLELELTESKLLEMVELNMQKLIDLRNYGVHISIDDFGKGFSSLSYLKQLPINTLKIDKSFVDDIPENDNSMIESIIHIGHQRNLTVVAEGVEKHEQVEFLSRYKCDIVQGYYFSEPVPEDEVIKLLDKKL
jgi:EAL domain-containing protein (putative c-di-GMP-specific phosphodiesterase class I)